MDTLSTLLGIGQSLWLEDTTREQLQSGLLVQHIQEGSITGAAITPLACSRVLRRTGVYDGAIRKKLAAGLFGDPLAMKLLLEDARHAADLLRPIYERTDGVDGWVALALFTPPASDTTAAVAAIATAYAKARRPNILLTLPGLPEWLPAIEEVIYSGVPVNIAFLLSREQFLSAARTCLRAIERRTAAGLKPAVTSFASISIGRLAAALSAELTGEASFESATAMARRIYKTSRDLHNSPEWERAYNSGARPLRLVWTMETADEGQRLSDSLIKNLMAPLTVAAIPETALKAITGDVFLGTSLPADGGDCEKVLAGHPHQGIDLNTCAVKLQNTEAAALTSSWIEMLDAVACKSAFVTNPDERDKYLHEIPFINNKKGISKVLNVKRSPATD